MEQAAVGSVRVANEVIASIAAMAVREIDGVAGLDQTNARHFGDWIKRETAHRGVRVALDSQRKIHLEVFVTVTAGFCGVVVMVKVFCVPTVKQVLFALVKAGLTGGGPGFGSVTAMLTWAVFESAEPLLALYSNESDGAGGRSLWRVLVLGWGLLTRGPWVWSFSQTPLLPAARWVPFSFWAV